MLAQPVAAGLLVGPLKRPPRRVFADDLAHPQQPRVDPVAADRADVRIAAMSGQQAQQQGAQHVALRRRIGAAVVERTIGDPVVEQPGGFEELDEVGHLPVGGHRRLGVPAQVHLAAVGVHRPAATALLCDCVLGLPQRVKPLCASWFRHPPQYQPLAPWTAYSTAVFRFIGLTLNTAHRLFEKSRAIARRQDARYKLINGFLRPFNDQNILPGGPGAVAIHQQRSSSRFRPRFA